MSATRPDLDLGCCAEEYCGKLSSASTQESRACEDRGGGG